VLAGLGYELVMLDTRRARALMRIFSSTKPGGVTIDDCVTVSNHLTHLVHRHEKHRLRQAGGLIARPDAGPGRWSSRQDYATLRGEQVTLKLRVPMDNRRASAGQLVGLENDAVKMIVDGNEMSIDLRMLTLLA